MLLADWAIIDGVRIESLTARGAQGGDHDNCLPKGTRVLVDAADFGLRYPAYWVQTEKGRFRAWKADLLHYSEPWTEVTVRPTAS